MSARLKKQLYKLFELGVVADEDVIDKYKKRLEKGRLTRNKNPESHFCAYFAGFDPRKGTVFIGHHKKSNSWMFTGGHIETAETSKETVLREIEEEWGSDCVLHTVPEPGLLTITEIDNERVSCVEHFDIWHFIPMSTDSFVPDESKLKLEFYEIGWKTINSARKLMEDKNSLLALDNISKLVKTGSE